MKLNIVVSLFDGMSCGQLALQKANIEYNTYFASEIDKYAIKVCQNNFPKTVQLGNVEDWRNWDIDWSKVDMIYSTHFWDKLGKEFAWHPFTLALYYFQYLEECRSL